MKTFTFNNKETYLAYRSEWKANYKTLTQEIRTSKTNVSKMQREKGYAGSIQYNLIKLRAQATSILEERKASKVEAQLQYLETKKELVIA